MTARFRTPRISLMKPKTLYLALCLAGLLLPYSQFVPWVLQHGLNPALFARELFGNRISAFFGMDVIVSAVALLAFTRIESSRVGIRRRWLVVVARRFEQRLGDMISLYYRFAGRPSSKSGSLRTRLRGSLLPR